MPQDVEALADLMLLAGGGTLQFVLDDLAPGVHARDLYAQMLASTDSECSYVRCHVAQIRSGVIGVVNAFPTDRLREGAHEFALSEREVYIRERTELQDWGSYFLNSIAVAPSFWRSGIGSRLIAVAGEQAQSEGFDRLSLHVWADNKRARSLYRRKGFEEIGRANVPWHPALAHEGGSILMRLNLRRGVNESTLSSCCPSCPFAEPGCTGNRPFHFAQVGYPAANALEMRLGVPRPAEWDSRGETERSKNADPPTIRLAGARQTT